MFIDCSGCWFMVFLFLVESHSKPLAKNPDIDSSTCQMKLRSGTWIDTAPDEGWSTPPTSQEKYRNVWTDVQLPLYEDQKSLTHPDSTFYKSLMSEVMQRNACPVTRVFLPTPNDSVAKPESDDLGKDRIRTRSSSKTIFPSLKYDLSVDKTSGDGIPKLTIRKRRADVIPPEISSKSEADNCVHKKTKRLKLIVGKESFHIDLEK